MLLGSIRPGLGASCGAPTAWGALAAREPRHWLGADQRLVPPGCRSAAATAHQWRHSSGDTRMALRQQLVAFVWQCLGAWASAHSRFASRQSDGRIMTREAMRIEA